MYSAALPTCNYERDTLEIFRQPHNGNRSVAEAEKDELFKQIGQLKVELEWLQKRTGFLD